MVARYRVVEAYQTSTLLLTSKKLLLTITIGKPNQTKSQSSLLKPEVQQVQMGRL